MKSWKRFRPRVEELESRLAPSTLTHSNNWSGYAVATNAGAVSQVAGTWVVPAVTSDVAGYSASWVGIDGAFSSTVEQTGTSSDFVNGKAHYYAWYEMYPAAPVTLPLTISPGDTISASVSFTSPNLFVLSLTNVTSGAAPFSTTQTSSQAQRSSAEWIEEAPSSFTGTLPLADFHTVTFAGANATVSGTPGPADNSWSGSTLYQVNMVSKNGSLKATPSALNDSGTPPTSSFSVTWVSSGSTSGKGGWRNSPNAPAAGNSSQTTTLASAALAALGASPQGGPQAFATTQAPFVPLAPTAPAVPLAQPAPTGAAAPVGYFALDTASGADEAADQANVPQWPAPNGSANPGAASRTQGLPRPQANQSPANVPAEAPLEIGWLAAGNLADAGFLPTASSEGMLGALTTTPNEQHIALACLVLTLAVDRTWTTATQGLTRRRSRVRGRPGQNRDGWQLEPEPA